ncbi:MAG: ribosome biogenesis GTPase Der [Candidatus Cloacimonetes bacterium]|nr:ribosome biogenesis GTPase Der [Candidatus Cloacimonadota bacterium]
MRKNIVAIVGRPNVGKSTLFNRICRKRSAIVHHEEGITRDRKYEMAEWSGQSFYVVDTGGIKPGSTDNIDTAVKYQAELAISEADLIIFLVDAKVGATDGDLSIARTLYPHKDKVILVANKVDNEKDQLEVYDFLQLGFGEAFPVAAVHGRNTGNFLDLLIGKLPETSPEPEDESGKTIKIAMIGRPNVGKSSLLNKFAGEEINIVDEVPGTTRDANDYKLKYFDWNLIFVDTAGLRRRQRVKYGVEYFSTVRTIESIDNSDIVLLILDATSEIATQDQKIASYAVRHFKEIILVVNKWDLISKDNSTPGQFVARVKDKLPFLEYAPVVFISALTGQRVRRILELILRVHEESSKRIPTSELNRFLVKVVGKFQPSHSSGKHARIFYCTQVKTKPPSFVFFCNNKKLISEHYKRYLHNQLRDTYRFEGATIRLFFRSRDESLFRD